MTLKSFGVLTWAFLAANFIYALGFILTAFTAFRTKSSLYESLDSVWDRLPEAWGLATMLAVLACLLAARFDWKRLGGVACSLGMAAWTYAMLIYIQTGYYVVALSIAALYLTFWVWLYFTHISKVTKHL